MTDGDRATIAHAAEQCMLIQFDYTLSGDITERHTVVPDDQTDDGDLIGFSSEYVRNVVALGPIPH